MSRRFDPRGTDATVGIWQGGAIVPVEGGRVVRPVLVVQHLEPEGPAVLEEVLSQAGCPIEVVRTDRQRCPDEVGRYGAVVVLGGPMSAAADDGFPSRGTELALLRDAVAGGTPLLGICLGAQLLAVALGAVVRPAPRPEIGWGRVRVHPAAASDPLFAGTGPQATVLHWHGETVDLPADAVLLASSEACATQAFRVGPAAWGLQFHLEVDAAAVERFVTAFPDDAARATGGAAGIRRATADALAELAPVRSLVLGRFVDLALRRNGSDRSDEVTR